MGDFYKAGVRETVLRPALIAICLATTLLCASCGGGASNISEKKSSKELAQLYTDLGTRELMRNDYPAAVEDLRKAITYNSQDAIARNHLGLAYYGLGKKDLAKAEIERAVVINSAYSDAYINLGKIAEDEAKFSLAKHYYTMALDNLEYKTRHRALTNLAELALRENNIIVAKRLLNQSLQVNPDYCLSHFLLGSILVREQNVRLATAEFKKSIAGTCTINAEAHYQLGSAYMKTKDYVKARSEFVYLVEQFPQSDQARRAGEQLRYIP